MRTRQPQSQWKRGYGRFVHHGALIASWVAMGAVALAVPLARGQGRIPAELAARPVPGSPNAAVTAAATAKVPATARPADSQMSASAYRSNALGVQTTLGGGDTCASATSIGSLPFADTGNTCGFTNDYDQACPYAGGLAPDVVYAYTPSANKLVDVSLCTNSAYDTKLYVYDNACPGTVTGCNDDTCQTPSYTSGAYVSALQGLSLTAGHTYYIVIDGYGSECGSYTIDVTEISVGNGDTCASAKPVTSLPFYDSGTTCGFGNDYEEACPYEGGTAPDVVYAYTPSADGPVDVSLCTNSAYDTKLYVYEDTCPGTVTGCNDDTCQTPSFPDGDFVSALTSLSLVAGHTYYIVIDGYGSGCGDYTIDVTPGAAPPPSCPQGTLFGQPVQAPSDPWNANTSDRGSPYLVFENFSGLTGDICDIHWWGLNASWDGSNWAACTKTSEAIDITFYLDASGSPGNQVCSYHVTATKTDTGLTYSGYPLYQYDVTLSPCCVLRTGWVSIQSSGDPNCWFLWMASGTGDGKSYQWDGTEMTNLAYDFSLCLTGTTAPCPVVPCPPEATQEPEPCGSDTNGGCNMTTPAYTPITCGQTFCGTAWADNGNRDTDWYSMSVPDTAGTGYARIDWRVDSQFPSAVFIVNTDCGAIQLLGSAFGDCQVPATASAILPVPASYWLFVATGTSAGGIYSGIPCGSGNNGYVATVTCTPMGPDIQIDPTSLTFECGLPTTARASCREASAVEPAPPAQKLVSGNEIIQALDNAEGGAVDVIVNLAPPTAVLATTDFDNAQSLGVLQAEVAKRQDAVLSALAKGEFTLRYRYQNMAAFSGSVTQAGLTKLMNDPTVSSIQPVRLLEAHLAQGIPLMNASGYRPTYNGAGMAVAICDTGIDYTHPMLGGGGFPNSKVIGGYDVGDSDADPMDCQGHGTCCAGLATGNMGSTGDYIGGVAYNAKLYAVKIAQACTGSATDAAMIAGWDWCVTHKNDDPANPILVISTSFGGGRFYSNCDAESPGMTTAANNAVAAGITVLASAGNDGFCDSMGWPACISSVISVGAVYDAAFGTYQPCLDPASCATKFSTTGCATGYYAIDNTVADMVTSYSNTANFLTILAPSNQAYTTDIVGTGGYNGSGDYYPGFGGTSAACPYAAGAVACLQQAARTLTGSYLSPAEIRSKLAATGDPIMDGKIAITKPRVNLGNAVDALAPCEGQTMTISNNGPVPLHVSAIDAPAWITLTPPPPYDVPPGGHVTVCVQANCSACSGSNLIGSLTVYSNDVDENPYPGGVGVELLCPVPPPVVTAAVSRKTHSGSGTFDVDVMNPSAVEGRTAGPTLLHVTFDKVIQSLTGTPADVQVSSGTVTGLVVGGSTLDATLSGVADVSRLSVSFFGIADASRPSAVVSDIVCFGTLVGDVNGDGTTNILDLVTIRNTLSQPVTVSNFRSDVNADAGINILDLVSVRNNLNKTIVGLCP